LSNFTIPIIIEELSGLERVKEPVRIGVPFSRGSAFEESRLRLRNDEGDCIPLQIKKLSKWSDGSIKWALVDFFVSLKESKRIQYELFHSNDTDDPQVELPVKLKIQEQTECIIVDTGDTKFEVQRHRLLPFSSVRLKDSEVISAGGSEVLMTDTKGRKYVAEIEKLLREEEGLLRCGLCAYGRFIHPGAKTLCNFTSYCLIRLCASILRNSGSTAKKGVDLTFEGTSVNYVHPLFRR